MQVFAMSIQKVFSMHMFNGGRVKHKNMMLVLLLHQHHPAPLYFRYIYIYIYIHMGCQQQPMQTCQFWMGMPSKTITRSMHVLGEYALNACMGPCMSPWALHAYTWLQVAPACKSSSILGKWTWLLPKYSKMLYLIKPLVRYRHAARSCSSYNHGSRHPLEILWQNIVAWLVP